MGAVQSSIGAITVVFTKSIHNRFRNDCYKFWDLSGQLYSIAITPNRICHALEYS